MFVHIHNFTLLPKKMQAKQVKRKNGRTAKEALHKEKFSGCGSPAAGSLFAMAPSFI